MSAPILVYTLDPESRAVWLTEAVATALRVSRGARLSREQMESRPVQEMLAARREKVLHPSGKEML